jgi:hypothetical protein
MDKFNIKYLWELYPDTDFTEELILTQTIQELVPRPDIQVTSNFYGDVRSSIKRQRLIQSVVFREYELKMVFARNINYPILTYAEYVTTTITRGDGEETFQIFNVAATYNKVPGTLNYILNLTFRKEDNDIINHLSSDNVLNYKTDLTETVNEIQYDVDNPSYSFNNVNIVATSITGATLAAFKLPLNGLTNTILVGDVYYLHTDDPDFDAEQDVLGGYLDFAECYQKDSDYVYLFCSDDEVNPAFDYDISNLIIDHEPDHRDLPLGVTVADKIISLVIYTLIEPNFSHVTEGQEGTNNAGREENQLRIEKDVCNLKAWLTTDEKWKAEYLNYALFSDIVISLKNYDDILPSQTKDIITIAPNDRLIDLFEYDINITYNVKEVDINR